MAIFASRDSSASPSDSNAGPRATGTRRSRSRIQNRGRWPVRVTEFHLEEPYEQPPVDYLEVFYVRSGSFLHDCDAGRQTLREGALIVSHPGNRHRMKHVESCHLTRVRFLPEWLADDFPTLVTSRFTVAALFGRQFFELPEAESIHVFVTRPERRRHLVSDLELLGDLLAEGEPSFHAPAARGKSNGNGDGDSFGAMPGEAIDAAHAACGELTRSTLVHFLLQIGEEFGHFLRHRGGMVLTPDQHHLLRDIEAHLNLQAPPESLEPTWIVEDEREAFAAQFKKTTGLTPADYLMRRRLDHAAHRLLITEQRTGIIAEGLGFADLADLTRHFEARYRISPAVYRQKFAPPPPSAFRRAAASRETAVTPPPESNADRDADRGTADTEVEAIAD